MVNVERYQKRNVKTFFKSDAGNFTIEASMIFPMILLITMSLIFFSLVIYYKSILQFEANRIADNVAFVWSNSTKDVKTGAFSQYTTDNGDGLYWRLTSNSILSKFELDFGGDDPLIGKKLHSELVSNIPGGVTGEVRYSNGLISNKGLNSIVVSLKQPLYLPPTVEKLFGMNIMEAQASRAVTEPVEFIRNTDFVIYFYDKIPEYKGYITQFKSKKK